MYILAFDHRAAFWDALGIAERQDRDELCRKAKWLIWKAFLSATANGQISGAAILVDDLYGTDILRGAKSQGVTFGMPVEASPAKQLEFEHGDDFGRALKDFAPSFTKVLIRMSDGIDLQPGEVDCLQSLGDFCLQQQLPWLCEIVMPKPSGTSISRSISQISGYGVRPNWWKVQGCDSRTELQMVADTALAIDANAKLLLLGQSADQSVIEQLLTSSATITGFNGFAVGRTIFAKPLQLWVADPSYEEDVIASMAKTYRRLCDTYAQASDVPLSRL